MAVTVHPAQKASAAPMIGVWHLAIPEASTRKDLAWDFLHFITSKEMQKTYRSGDRYSPNTSQRVYR